MSGGLGQQDSVEGWNYYVTRRELLAAVKTLEYFHKYLYGQEFHLCTHHAALTWLPSFKNFEGQTARWLQRVQRYIWASSGRRHTNADTLSRKPCQEESCHCLNVEQRADGLKIRVVATATANDWDRAALRREQLADDDLGQLLQELDAGQRPEWRDISDRSPVYKSYWTQCKSLAVRDGVLERHWESANRKTRTALTVIPRGKVKEVLAEMRGGPSGGHLGVKKALDNVWQRYYWLHLKGDVERLCQQCDTCVASRGPRTRSWAWCISTRSGRPLRGSPSISQGL
jgi:hypothetical protein